MPWQLPQNTPPLAVHTGREATWQLVVPQVCAERSHDRLALTSAGGGVSMWPGSPTWVGTRWQVSHGIGPRRPVGTVRWARWAPTPIAVICVLPDRSVGGAGDVASPWQPEQPGPRPTWTTPSMCGALAGWQVAQLDCAWLGGGAPWQRSQLPGGVGSAHRGSVAVPPAACSASPWQYTLLHVPPWKVGGPLRSARSIVRPAR